MSKKNPRAAAEGRQSDKPEGFSKTNFSSSLRCFGDSWLTGAWSSEWHQVNSFSVKMTHTIAMNCNSVTPLSRFNGCSSARVLQFFNSLVLVAIISSEGNLRKKIKAHLCKMFSTHLHHLPEGFTTSMFEDRKHSWRLSFSAETE